MVLKKFENSSGVVFCTVSYDEANACVIDTWEGMFGSQDNFKKVLNYVVGVIEEKKATKWLANLNRMNGSFDGSKDWIVSDIMPKVLKAGLLFQAIVLPANIFSKLSTRDAAAKIQNFELKQFDDIIGS